MLETIREYAMERLVSVASGGGTTEARTVLRSYGGGCAAQSLQAVGRSRVVVEVHETGERAQQPVSGARLGQKTGAETAARLAIALWWIWIERGYLSDGRRWMETILAAYERRVQAEELRTRYPHARRLTCSR